MVHDSTWLGGACARRRMRSTTLLGLLLACALLAGFPVAASASTTEMRGEWELVVTTVKGSVKGTALITQEANAQGEFASSSARFESVLTGTFSGTLEGAKATVLVTTEAYGPVAASKFESSTMTVESTGGALSLSGTGTLTSGTETASATLLAKRIRTYKQIEEQEAKEKQEREEKEARENIRGEWSLTLTAGAQTSHGTALITTNANAKNEFASSGAMFEAVIPGSFSGTLEYDKAHVTITTEAYGPAPASKFESSTIKVEPTGNPTSMSGEGTLTIGTTELPGATLTATRVKTYKEVTERLAKEKLELEAKEKTEREAKEKAEHEAKEKLEREAREKAEAEAKQKAEAEARAKAEREAKEKLKITPPGGGPGAALPLVSVQPVGKAFTVGASELLTLSITNPNAYAVSARVTLLMTETGKAGRAASAAGHASKRTVSLGTASFGISATGRQLVKIKLSKLGKIELARHPSIRAIATITTRANGQTTTIKTFALTLRAVKPAKGKH